MTELKQIHMTVIAAAPDRVWQAITEPEFTQQYWHATRVHSDWQVGSDITFLVDNDVIGCEGKILKADRPKELAYTWQFPRNPQTKDEEPSRVTFLLEAVGKHTKLTVIHDQFPDATKMYALVKDGWVLVLGGLKTLLETGRAVDFSATG